MFARLNLVHQGKLFLQLTRRRLTLLLFMRRKLGSSSQAGRETVREREKVCSSSSPMRGSITQPCLCFPNSFWFSRKLWAIAAAHKYSPELSFFASPRGLSQTCGHSSLCVCSWLWTHLKVCVCVCVSHSDSSLSRNTNVCKRSLALTAALA